MAKQPGQTIEPNDGTTSLTLTATAAVSAGQAVGVSGEGSAAPADDTNETTPIGIASDRGGDAESGEALSVETRRGAVVVASVAAGATAGTLVGASATEGQLASGTGTGPDNFAILLSNEGGSYKGSIPSGYAAVMILK